MCLHLHWTISADSTGALATAEPLALLASAGITEPLSGDFRIARGAVVGVAGPMLVLAADGAWM